MIEDMNHMACPQCKLPMLNAMGASCSNCGYPKKDAIFQWNSQKQLNRIEKKIDALILELNLREHR